MSTTSMGDLLWQPDPARAEATSMAAFRRRVAEAAGVDLPDTPALQRWGLAHLDDLWRAVWHEVGMAGDPGGVALDRGDGSMLGARFFPEARTSVAAELLAGAGQPDAATAIVWEREDGQTRTLSWGELRRATASTAAALRHLGVGPGHRVAAWMPNLPETVIAMAATLAVGAVFTSCSADFGPSAVVDRFGQVEPSVLLAADGYLYGGKRFDCLSRLGEVRDQLPTLRATVVVGHLTSEPDLSGLPSVVRFDEWLAATPGDQALDPVLAPFDAPGLVLYSSGTTGKPKCIVHRGAGVLLKHRGEQVLHHDVRRGDRVFYFTTCGWMMWNWLTSALATGATIVLYEGSPGHPRPGRLLELVDRHQITLFGTSAKYLDVLRGEGWRAGPDHPLASLRTICSTGSPLSPQGFAYVYEHLRADVHLSSISGGTDICGCFVGGDPTRPVHAGEIQGPVLGMGVDVFDDAGRPLARGRGELVCTAPFPSTPLGFWGDPGGHRYRATYFERFPGVWAQGDLASWTEHGGVVIHGRSDATLNPGGVRIGTAEIYGVVEALDEVAEAIAVGQEVGGDTRVVLFIRPAAGAVVDDALRRRLRDALRAQRSPRHVPAVILAVEDIPRTRSGKICEVLVTDVVNGRDPADLTSLANPEAVAEYRDRPELDLGSRAR